jgi:putative transposase
MARHARAVIPSILHHITQRGNCRQETFFSADDYRSYLELMADWCTRFAVDVWAYCLMLNHIHLITVPHSDRGLRQAIGEAHRRYTRLINVREGWRGHLWQGRFSSGTRVFCQQSRSSWAGHLNGKSRIQGEHMGHYV